MPIWAKKRERAALAQAVEAAGTGADEAVA